MERYSIRKAAPENAVELNRLNRAFNGVDSTPAETAARIAAAEGIESAYLAFDGATAAGFACLRLVPSVCDPLPQAELTELYVDPAYRRQGVASRLVRYVENLAASAGASALIIRTGRDNTGAQNLYQTLGYTLDDITFFRCLSGSEK